MIEKWRESRYGYPFLLTALTAAVWLAMQNDLCRYHLPGWVVLVIAALAALGFLAAAIWRLRFLAAVGAAVAAGFAALWFTGRLPVLREVLGAFCGWYFAGRGEGSAAEYGVALAISGAAAAVLGALSARFARLQRALAILILFLLAGSFLANRAFGATAAVTGLLYLFVTAVDLCQQRGERQEAARRRRILLTLFPVFALAGILLALAPKPQEAYDWKFARDLARAVGDAVEEAVNRIRFYSDGESDVFSLRFAGYTDDATLGGNVLKTEEPALFVSFRTAPRTNLYLVGSIWDTFAGDAWSARAGEAPEEPDYLGGRAESEEERQARNALYSLVSVRVTYADIYTETLFLPEFTTKVTLSSGKWEQDSVRAKFSSPKGEGTSYEAAWRQLNLGSEEWDAFVRGCLADGRRDDAYTDYVYETYAQRPTFSEEVLAYLDKATAEAKTPYDALLAVEALLRSYTYTTRPQAAWEGEDFLDTFLLQTQEGYCTYFATAFTLIARHLGFPARYVQGYCVPAAGVGSGTETAVSSQYAHAWTQVWLDGVGWVPFEPTPSYGELRYVPWTVRQEETAPAKPEEPEQSEPFVPHSEEAGEAPQQQRLPAALQIAVPALLLFAAAVGVLVLLLEGRRRVRERKRTSKEQFAWDFLQCAQILTALGVARSSWETFGAYRGRLLRLPELADAAAELPVAAYEALCYGEIAPAAEDVAAVRQARARLCGYYERHHSWLRNRILRARLRYGSPEGWQRRRTANKKV